MSVLYMLNAPAITIIQASQFGTDQFPLFMPVLPEGWNKPRTRVRIRISGDFQLAVPNDVFTRKLWLGKTQLTTCSVKSIMPNEGRAYSDAIEFYLYGDNLHGVSAVHFTGLCPTTYAGSQSGNSIQTEQNRNAVPALTEITRSDAPLIIDSIWTPFQVSYAAVSKGQTATAALREFVIEQFSA